MNACHVEIAGCLPRDIGLPRGDLKRAVEYFAARSSARVGIPFRAVSIILQDNAFSSEVHEAVNGVSGATDAITQRYDALPGEEPGVYGEVYVNVDRAREAAPRRRGWSTRKELLLYAAHGIDHLSGADDLSPDDYDRMRRRELGWLRDFFTAHGGKTCRN